MLYNNWKKDIWRIPNLLSLFRLVMIQVYVSIYPCRVHSGGILPDGHDRRKNRPEIQYDYHFGKNAGSSGG